jgi:hypothetical protein
MSDPSLLAISPIPIICAYDDAVAALWGEPLRRPWPHANDKVVAERWIAAGATLDLCRRVFREVLEKRRARSLTIPFSLSYFENMVRDAITTAKEAPPDDPETARWRSRVQGWRKNAKLWIEDQWGPIPGADGCRVPKRVLSTMGI